MSSPSLATALSADSQTDSQTDSVRTPNPVNHREKALLIACITIALERFAFYTLVSLFVLYLVATSLFLLRARDNIGTRCIPPDGAAESPAEGLGRRARAVVMEVIAHSDKMARLLRLMRATAQSDKPALMLGASGSGRRHAVAL